MRLAALTILWLAALAATSVAQEPCTEIRNSKRDSYGFRPSQLSEDQRAQKSASMDKFWNLVKAQGVQGLTCLRELITEEQSDAFFLYDGASLLYSLDTSDPSMAAIHDALLRSDLGEVDPPSYVNFTLQLSKRGVPVGRLAVKYLTYPKAEGYVPQHAMGLDRLTGSIVLFGSMPPEHTDKHLIPLLNAKESYVRETTALLLAFNMTEDSFRALAGLGDMSALPPETRKEVKSFTTFSRVEVHQPPKFSREQVLRAIRRIPHTEEEFEATIKEESQAAENQGEALQKGDSESMGEYIKRRIEEGEPHVGISGHKRFEESAIATLTADDIPEIREARRKAVHGVSDETLYEYYAYTRIILGVINRLDLYSEYRKH